MKAKKIKELIVPTDEISGWHRIFYKPSQVERCLPCSGIKPKTGLRLAMLFPHDEFMPKKGKVPIAKFFLGKITRVSDDSDDPVITIRFDGNPYCSEIMCGFKAKEKFCIPYPTRHGAKTHSRARDGKDRSKR